MRRRDQKIGRGLAGATVLRRDRLPIGRIGDRLPYPFVGQERMRELRAGALALGRFGIRVGEVDHDSLGERAERSEHAVAPVCLDGLE